MSRLREEGGWTVISAMMVGIITLSLGLVVLATVDVQTHQSARERAQESSFQLAESALNNTALQLTRTWPNSSGTAYPICTQASVPSTTCIGNTLTPNYTATASGAPRGGVDFSSAPTFNIRVLDDTGGANYYSDSIVGSAPAYDANGDGYLWVRADSTVAGRSTVLVMLVGQGATQTISLPKNAITAGWVRTTNTGRKVILDVKGNSAVAGIIAVRCNASAPSSSSNCLGWDPGKGQLTPASAWKANYVDGNTTPNSTNRTVLDAATLAKLKSRAQSLGTYYAAGTCPSSLTGPTLADGTRAPIYVENANCSYTSNSVFNTAALPGVVVFGSGTLTFGGSVTYYGVIYMANGQGSAPSSGPCTSGYQNTVVTTTGNSLIQGAMYIDKCGGYAAGSSKMNFIYDSNAALNVVVSGTTQAIKNSFRIVSTS